MSNPALPTDLSYSQLQFDLFAGGVYAFRKHRIEMRFKWGNPAGFSGLDGLRLMTDGGVTYSLDFHPDGSVKLFSEVLVNDPIFGWRVTEQMTHAGDFDPALPVHAILETDVAAKTAKVTVNGVVHTVSGLAELGYALRNGELFSGPFQLRLSLDDRFQDAPLALESFRISGSDYDGPLLQQAGDPQVYSEEGVVVLPVKVPPTGSWRPEFSLDGVAWTPFAVPLTAGNKVVSAAFGSVVSPRAMVRLRSVDP